VIAPTKNGYAPSVWPLGSVILASIRNENGHRATEPADGRIMAGPPVELLG
jgi:hypothetical protein